jgi:hypothetical protein
MHSIELKCEHLTGHPVGLLMNFNGTTLKAGLKRLDHPDLYVKKTS